MQLTDRSKAADAIPDESVDGWSHWVQIQLGRILLPRVRNVAPNMLCASLVAISLAPAETYAQSTTDRLLSRVSVSTLAQCAVIDVSFNEPVTYSGHFPPNRGLELLVRLEPLGTEQTPDRPAPPIESASVLPGNSAGLTAATFDAGRFRPQLRLTFDHPVQFTVSRGTDSRHLKITTRGDGSPDDCQSRGESAASDAATDGSSGALSAGKGALARGEYSRAVALLTKVKDRGEGSVKQEAHEYLGLARERADQLAHAAAEYKSYLELYPKGDGAARVRQRLSSVNAAINAEAESRRLSHKKVALKSDETSKKRPTATVTSQDAKSDFGSPGSETRDWKWTAHGSAGQFYYRDDGLTDVNVLRGTVGTHSIRLNEVVSSGDVTIRGADKDSEIEIRLSGYQETGLDAAIGESSTNVSTAYVDLKNKTSGLSLRAGRQYRSESGVFGRFDGALATWHANRNVQVRAIAGSPVYYRSDGPLADGRYFYGGSVDWSMANDRLSTSLYAIEQDVRDVIDRRAIGTEVRYADDSLTMYGGLDIDIHYGEVNSAYVSASWLVSSDLTVYGNADYRRVPFLLTSNALMGQSVGSLAELLDLFGRDTTEQLALDRTALAETVMLGASYKLTEDWQLALDATLANYSGTPASGGVDAIPDPGTELYISGIMNGTNVLTENDSVSVGLRYLDGSSYRTYMTDIAIRYPLSEALRLTPRLRLAFRDSKRSDLQQILIMPSLGTRYSVTDHWKFEVEAAARFESNWGSAGGNQNVELLLTAGYRYEF